MDIQGTPGSDYLIGTSDPDLIRGLGGNDTLDGGAGADTLEGGQGDDVYIVDNEADIVRELLGEGADTIFASVSYSLGAAQEVEVLSARNHAGTEALNFVGNNFAQTMYGNAGANLLNGLGGIDVMIGLAGNDTYVVDRAEDQVIEGFGGGDDTVFTNISYSLGSNQYVEVLSVQTQNGTSALDLVGNQLNNTLYGNFGNNLLNGVDGADTMIGLYGDDTYVIDNVGDLVIDLVGQGNDVVLTYVSHTLTNGNDIETLSTVFHQGTTAIDLGGNDYANHLIGNYGNNYLNGGGGADVMTGFFGNDTYVVENAADQIEEAAGQGNDAVFSFVSYALAAGQEIETLSTAVQSGTTALDLTGNEFGQVLYGNNGANVLNGGLGNDTLVGLGGADVFAFTTALGAGNVDTIADFQTGSDKIRLSGAAGQPFAALASGALRAGTLAIGAAALDADDYLIYNSATGALLYDADGNGAGAAVQFATLSTGLALTAADFTVAGPANNAPAITSGGTASIAENSAASTVVYQVAASDADGDRITYSLTGADASLLTIDASGAVRLLNPADFEVKATYSFSVVASDSAASTSRAVTLAITDVVETPSTPIIDEAAASNDTRLTAQTIDRGIFTVGPNSNLPNDSLPSGTIVGSISANSDKDFFSITLQAGEQLILDVDGTNGGLDSLLRVFGPTGQSLGENDDQVSFDPGSVATIAQHNTDSFFKFRAPTAGTYYFSIEGFEQTSSGGYRINVSIGPPASALQILEEDRDALISGAAWNHTNLTYGFPTDAAQYPASFSEPDQGFAAFTGTQQNATRALLDIVAKVSALTFSELTANPGQADLRYATSSEPDVAYAYYPTNSGPNSLGGTAWFNNGTNGRFANPVKGNYAWMGILHETGHALGLKHGHEAPAISPDHDSVEYSVMTYRSFPGGSVEGGYSNESFGYPQTLMMLDIAALQKIYGANYGTANTDSVYRWSNATGELSINNVGQGAPGANRVFMTVWDGGGDDTYDLSNYSDNLTIDLRPGEWTTTNSFQTANLGQNHFARGNIANALLVNGNTASAIENAVGGSGEDTLIANLVANRLTGNGNADVFRWTASGDAGTGALADTIADFLRGTDKIDLSAIDTDPGLAGDQGFAFLGQGAFTGGSDGAEVRYTVVGNAVHVFADVDGNGTADMQIIVSNNTIIAASDFMF